LIKLLKQRQEYDQGITSFNGSTWRDSTKQRVKRRNTREAVTTREAMDEERKREMVFLFIQWTRQKQLDSFGVRGF
jgi:hypothetical protein